MQLGVLLFATVQSFQGLGVLDPAAVPSGSFATGMSSDGAFVVGSSFVATGQGTELRGFRWSESTGFEVLGLPTAALPLSLIHI